MAKILTIIAVVVLIALGAYFFLMNPVQKVGTAENNDASAAGSNDSSDAALEQDSAAIDAQIGAFASDNSNVDSGMNDQPVAQ